MGTRKTISPCVIASSMTDSYQDSTVEEGSLAHEVTQETSFGFRKISPDENSNSATESSQDMGSSSSREASHDGCSSSSREISREPDVNIIVKKNKKGKRPVSAARPKSNITILRL